jgi:leucyl/phenylalanyl-tRNA---protein transferase
MDIDPYKIRKLNPEQVLSGYYSGVFPMGDSDNTVNWYEAEPRGIIPIGKKNNRLHITRSLKQSLNKNIFEIKINTAFVDVINNCSKRSETWINNIIIDVYCELHKLGFAHSVEAWRDRKLVGGLYGVSLNGAFFGESMFYEEKDASKVCVVKLYEILKQNDYLLFDIQMITPVFKTFGAVHITKKRYLEKLKEAMSVRRYFNVEREKRTFDADLPDGGQVNDERL